MLNPDFSVIMPAYNAEAHLAEAIESVLAQTHENFELIVIDDHSLDGTAAALRRYERADKRIKTVFNTENSGVGAARNLGIAIAKGRYIAFLDSDDLWLPQKLEVQKLCFEQGYDYVYSSYLKFWPDGKEKFVIAPPNPQLQSLMQGNYIGNLTGAYDCSRIGKVFQKSIGHEDYLMWIQVTKRSQNGCGIDQPLAKYRVRTDSVSSKLLRNAAWTWNIYRNELKLGYLPSISNFFFYALNAIKKR